MNLDLREIPFYYINLDDAVERREKTESQLKELGIKSITRACYPPYLWCSRNTQIYA